MARSLYNKIKKLGADLYAKIIALPVGNQIRKIQNINSPFFIIAIPGSLHIVELCLHYVPSSQNIIIISNGLSQWEYEWSRDNLQYAGLVSISKILEHGQVIDIIINHYQKPFGILDYDCFVFNPSIYSKITDIDNNTMLNALFVHRNELMNLDIPETFILYINCELIKKIQTKYDVNSQIQKFHQVSKKAKVALENIGINEMNYPEEHKDYFDSLRLWYCLGILEGYKTNFLKRLPTVSSSSDDIFHVGGSSNKLNFNSKWVLRGSYFWWRVLETCRHKEIQKVYHERYGNYRSSDILRKNQDLSLQLEPEFFQQVEKIIAFE